MRQGGIRRNVLGLAAAGMAAIGLGACGGGGSAMQMPPPPDPVTMALQAPGVRTVVVPRQSDDLTVVVPPCGLSQLDQETTETPPGSNKVVVPKSSLDQTIAVQPCMQGVQNVGQASTVLLSPGSSQSPGGQQSGQTQNQLLLPEDSNIERLIVPPCLVIMASSSSSSSSGGQPGATDQALPSSGDGARSWRRPARCR